jgi:photosystem I subunit 3
MRRLFALVLAVSLWFGVALPASADVAGLTPCGESAAFQQRAANATTDAAKARFEFYGNSSLLCGSDGLPHLIVDGDLAHLGEFIIPSLSVPVHCRLDWLGRSVLSHCCARTRRALKRKRSSLMCLWPSSALSLALLGP